MARWGYCNPLDPIFAMPVNNTPLAPPVEVRLTKETIDYLDQRIKEAVQGGISSAITEETAKLFWAAGLNVLQEQASTHAGRFVIGGLWGLIRKLSMFLLLGGIVYAIGGWAALIKLWNILFTSGT